MIQVRYRILKDGSKSAYLDIYTDGQRSYHTTGIRIYKRDPQRLIKLEKIEAIRLKFETDLFARTHGPTQKNIKLFDYMQRRIDAINNTTTRQYVCMMAEAQSLWPEDIRLSELTYQHCQSYIDHLYSKFTRGTAAIYYSKLSRILNDAVRDHLIGINPARDVLKKPRQTMRIKQVILIDDFRKVINTPFDRADKIRRAVILSYYTGMGLTDIRALDMRHIDGNTVHYTRAKTKISVSVKVRPEILELCDIPIKGIPLPQNVNKILKEWCLLANVRPITFYSLRHSFAVNLLINGINIERVRLLMGHASLDRTQVYLRYIESMRSDEDEVLPGL